MKILSSSLPAAAILHLQQMGTETLKLQTEAVDAALGIFGLELRLSAV